MDIFYSGGCTCSLAKHCCHHLIGQPIRKTFATFNDPRADRTLPRKVTCNSISLNLESSRPDLPHMEMFLNDRNLVTLPYWPV